MSIVTNLFVILAGILIAGVIVLNVLFWISFFVELVQRIKTKRRLSKMKTDIQEIVEAQLSVDKMTQDINSIIEFVNKKKEGR